MRKVTVGSGLLSPLVQPSPVGYLVVRARHIGRAVCLTPHLRPLCRRKHDIFRCCAGGPCIAPKRGSIIPPDATSSYLSGLVHRPLIRVPLSPGVPCATCFLLDPARDGETTHPPRTARAMSRNTTRLRARLVVFAGVSLLLLGAQAQATCYNTWREEDTNQQPCSVPGADAGAGTWCCNRGDTCLSNGLCLSPDSSNLMTQQGCTDKAWGGSCTKFCPASTDRPSLPAIPLIPCPSTLDSTTNTLQHCCGNTNITDCCSTHSSSRLTLSPGTILSQSQSQNNNDSTSYSLKIGLGIGLGIGIPILLVLLAVAYLLAQPVHSRRQKRRREQQHRRGGGGGSGSGGGGGDGKRRGKPGGTLTEKTSDTSHTYPPPRSFGRVDTRTDGRASSELGEGEVVGMGMGMGAVRGGGAGAHAWPPMPIHGLGGSGGGGDGGPVSASSVATAIAQWARSPFGFGGMEPPPPSPKEMDASSGRRGWRGTTSRLGAAELPSPDPNMGSSRGRESGVRGWKEGRHVHVAAEVELPSPDTPERDVERGLGGRI
ncbi:hypothetical protein F5144DRAFT_351497 [Chaetomium tenue]|uniref:Uncharacterized protein n=1 Tax=Chaetomium tenue TaxID=1854479 RepID=A0ACB7NY10_9PEZI|nr:hypothetical protein F5144DRAFT_351497 [Chaetomium globosum]